MSEPLTDDRLQDIRDIIAANSERMNADLELAVADLRCEVDRLRADNAALRKLHEARCERVAAASEVIAVRAERDALARLEAWAKCDNLRRPEVGVTGLGGYCRLICYRGSGPFPQIEVYARSGKTDRWAVYLYDGATMAEAILAALEHWERIYGDKT